MKDTLRYRLGAIGIGLAMTFGAAVMAPVSAQETPDAPVVAEEDDGFDDWGLFGLLGLIGLAGLKKREDESTHVVERRNEPLQ